MAEVSNFKIGENTYSVKDVAARSQIANIGIKKCVLVGDSYTTNDPMSGGVTYPLNFGQLLVNFGYVNECHNYGQNGTRYSASSTNNFMVQLSTASSDLSFDNDDINIVIIEGGQNERFESDFANSPSYYNKLYARVKQTIEYAKTNFKNADIYCVPMFWNGSERAYDYRVIWNAIYSAASNNGALIDKNSIFYGRGALYSWGTDRQHPTYETLQKMVHKTGNLLRGSTSPIDISFVVNAATNYTQNKIICETCDDKTVSFILSGYNDTAIPNSSVLALVQPCFIDRQTQSVGTITSLGDKTGTFFMDVDATGTGTIKCFKEIAAGERFTVKFTITL